jgi:hypothetical protein
MRPDSGEALIDPPPVGRDPTAPEEAQDNQISPFEDADAGGDARTSCSAAKSHKLTTSKTKEFAIFSVRSDIAWTDAER